jgi:hypothetical protein
MRSRLFAAALFVLVLRAALLPGQQLTIQTATGKPSVLARADIEALPHIKVTTGASDSPTTLEGVALRVVLERAGVEFGEKLKARRLASCLLVEATDGYRVVIALPEIDPAFTDKPGPSRLLERWQAAGWEGGAVPPRDTR